MLTVMRAMPVTSFGFSLQNRSYEFRVTIVKKNLGFYRLQPLWLDNTKLMVGVP